MIVRVMTWDGSPQDGGPREIGRVTVVDGAATWDPALDRLMGRVVAGGLDPAQGDAFLSELPRMFRNAPYCWAEAAPSPPP